MPEKAAERAREVTSELAHRLIEVSPLVLILFTPAAVSRTSEAGCSDRHLKTADAQRPRGDMTLGNDNRRPQAC